MIRFDTVAANADVIGDDTPMAGPGRGPVAPRPGGVGPETGRGAPRRDGDGAPGSGAGKAGQDINAPGFLKDQDAGKPA